MRRKINVQTFEFNTNICISDVFATIERNGFSIDFRRSVFIKSFFRQRQFRFRLELFSINDFFLGLAVFEQNLHLTVMGTEISGMFRSFF